MRPRLASHVLAFAHESPYPGPPEGKGGPPIPPPVAAAASAAWKVILTLGGASGCTVLLLRPSLRDTAAWLVCGGAAGIFPLDRILDRFGFR
jgi:hypothetical protein